MAQYISKSALVAKIENWKQHTLKCGYVGQGEYEEGNKQGRLDTCEKILSIIDTLEVKEVQEPTASDRGMVEEIIVNLKRVENDYRIDLTKQTEWLRNIVKKGK